MKKTLASIDLAKFIASVLIFAMHCGVLNDYKYVSIVPQIMARWGVPFFFICSAFFLFNKSVNGNIEKKALIKYIHRIMTLYAIWLMFNIPNVVYLRLWSKDLSSISTWLIFLKNSVLSSTFTGSWYLTSCILSAWCVYALSKKYHTQAVMSITFVLYLLCVFTSVYKGVLPSNISIILKYLCFPLNIFNGCFYFALGKYIAENSQSILKRCSKKKALLGAAIFYILFTVEVYLTKHHGINGGTDVAFSTVLLSVSIFFLCLQTSIRIENSLLLRNLSTIIYCSQGDVLLLNGFCKKVLNVPSILSFLISSVASAVICIGVLYLQKSKPWRWTNYLT